MNRLILEECTKLCSKEIGWPLDAVTSAWEKVAGLDCDRRSLLTPDSVAAVLDLEPGVALRFLLGGFRAGLFEARWQIFHPVSGWIVQEADSLGGLSGELLYDPFCRESIEPDLSANVLVVFRPHSALLEECRGADFSDSWDAYRKRKMAWPFLDGSGVPNVVPLVFSSFKPWELGKLEFKAKPGDVFRVISLETRSSFTLKVDGQASIPGESFILKMESYRKIKAQENAGRQALDLLVLPSGFQQAEAELLPGRILLWIDNRSGAPTNLSVWKTPVLPGPQPQREVWNARSVLNDPEARQTLISHRLPEAFHIRVGGQAFLFAGLEDSATLMEDRGDKDFYRFTKQTFEGFLEVVDRNGGFFFQKGIDSISFCFPESLAAVAAAVELHHLDPQGLHLAKFAVFSGSVLLTAGEGGLQFFGYAVNLGRRLLERIHGGELWVALGTFSYPGVSDFFLNAGYHCRQEMVSLKNNEQMSLVYECSRG